MISSRFRILGALLCVALAISALAGTIPSEFRSSLSTVLKPYESANRVEKQSPSSNPSAANTTQLVDAPKSKEREQFTLYTNSEGEIVCRAATPAERQEMDAADLQKLGLRPINHLEVADKLNQSQAPAAANLTIILRATQQLQQNQTATNAFIRAAQNWENVIMSPVTIYIDVDYGATNFGQTWPSGVLGATSTSSHSYPYQSVRTNLIAEANGEGNATKQALFNALPSTTVPSDLGDSGSTIVSDSSARAIGLLPATAQSTDNAARIAFNSNFTFDFDPSDGITAGQIDFDAVATHEIGHALGFGSDAGLNLPRPSVWDLYRFRTGTTTGTFPTASRILTIGGSPDPLQFYFAPGNAELGLSTGGPAGSTANGGDGWQSSHWKHVTGCGSPIGIMDPAIPSGCRRTITSSDVLALSTFGYNLANNNAPPPAPPAPTPPSNDNFASAQTISGCSGTINGTTFGATSEAGEPSHDPSDATSLSPNHTVWFQWQAPSSGTTTITTAGSDFDTIVAVYSGSSLGSLTRLAFNDDVQNGVIVTSTVTFSATAGTTYRIAVDGWGGDTGSIKLNWNGCVAPTPTPTPTPTSTPTPTPTPTPQPCSSSFTVNDNGDAPDAVAGNGVCATGGGVCTLRAAIEEANSNASCGAIDINLNGLAGSIMLNSALSEINHNVNLNGPAASVLALQRSSAPGTPQFRILVIRSSRIVRISGITISNGNLPTGNNGAGIFNSGTLILDSCNVFGNSVATSSTNFGGGIYSNGTLTLNNTNIGGVETGQGNTATDGGGIYSIGATVVMTGGSIVGNAGGGLASVFGGSITLTNVAITNNRSLPNGGTGGIFSGTLAFLTNCLIANNSSQIQGSGFGNTGTATIINTTVSGNSSSANGGGISNQSNIINTNPLLRMTNVTVTRNRSDSDGVGTEQGGGIYNNGGTITLNNTLVAENFRGTGATRDDVNGVIQSSGSCDLIGDGSGMSGITNGVSGNRVGTSVSPIDAVLGSLANNGGPTMTHALLGSSPAINAGSNALAVDQNGNALTTDQRGTGFNRIIGGTVDIGAFEVQTIATSNPIDEPSFFVKQHYLDFLNRQPDQSGWDFWTNQITSCGSNAQCIEATRVNVSASFFLSIEFQQTGYLVERMYKVAYGDATGNSTFNGAHPLAVPMVRFNEFLTDTQRIGQGVVVLQPGWDTLLENNKQAYASEFVQTSRFIGAFPTSMTPADFVDKLNSNAGNVLSPSERTTAINLFGGSGNTTNTTARAQAVRQVAEDTDLYNAEFNRAFVLAEYFGYLRRNPNDAPESTLDYTGYDFWLTKLNQFNGNYINAEMVKAFLSSIEYRQRFGP